MTKTSVARLEQKREYYIRHRDRIRAYKQRPEVKARHAAQERHRRVVNPDLNRAYNLNMLYGLSEPEYDALLVAQGGVCAICQRPESTRHQSGTVRRLAVDHDHRTGLVRGLLCGACNSAVGYMEDQPERMIAAAAYLLGGAKTA